jgi:hypothetical protein
MLFFLNYVMKWLENLKKNCKLKVDNKYVWKWMVKLSLNIFFH